MTHSVAYFVHSKTHQIVNVHEHSYAVKSSPERFGILHSELEGACPQRDRILILTKALELGWIRVRRRRDDFTSVEFSCTWIEAFFAIGANLEPLGFGPLNSLLFRNITTGKSVSLFASEIETAMNEKRIQAFLDSKIK